MVDMSKILGRCSFVVAVRMELIGFGVVTVVFLLLLFRSALF